MTEDERAAARPPDFDQLRFAAWGYGEGAWLCWTITERGEGWSTVSDESARQGWGPAAMQAAMVRFVRDGGAWPGS